MNPKFAFITGEEESKPKLSGLDKLGSHVLGIRAGLKTCREMRIDRRGESSVRGHGKWRGHEALVFFFGGRVNQVMLVQQFPISVCQLDTFTIQTLNDAVESRILVCHGIISIETSLQERVSLPCFSL